MARIPEPNNIRSLKGERHKDRYLPDSVQVKTLTELPEPPEWWSDETVKIYQDKGRLLLAHQMLTELDISYVQQLCLIESKLNEIWKSGDIPQGILITQFNSYCAYAGLSLISRQKIKASAARKEGIYAKINSNKRKGNRPPNRSNQEA